MGTGLERPAAEGESPVRKNFKVVQVVPEYDGARGTPFESTQTTA